MVCNFTRGIQITHLDSISEVSHLIGGIQISEAYLNPFSEIINLLEANLNPSNLIINPLFLLKFQLVKYINYINGVNY